MLAPAHITSGELSWDACSENKVPLNAAYLYNLWSMLVIRGFAWLLNCISRCIMGLPYIQRWLGWLDVTWLSICEVAMSNQSALKGLLTLLQIDRNGSWGSFATNRNLWGYMLTEDSNQGTACWWHLTFHEHKKIQYDVRFVRPN